jgi:tRNA U34 5-methylaminomethyl-2-thiouridine-forming methyltransferase MnmC
MSTDQNGIDWDATGVPISRRFGDPYFSLDDGLAETWHVFLAGNGLPERFRDGFRIAELGFGTGLNLAATAMIWAEAGAGRLSYTSFEAYPLTADEIWTALGRFPELAAVAAPLVAVWGEGRRRFSLDRVDVEVIVGDARATLPGWKGMADAWYLDGFSPAKNPEMWAPDLMAGVARHTVPGGTFATYTAAGEVRRALADAGFEVTRQDGFGRKRHMTTGRRAGGG